MNKEKFFSRFMHNYVGMGGNIDNTLYMALNKTYDELVINIDEVSVVETPQEETPQEETVVEETREVSEEESAIRIRLEVLYNRYKLHRNGAVARVLEMVLCNPEGVPNHSIASYIAREKDIDIDKAKVRVYAAAKTLKNYGLIESSISRPVVYFPKGESVKQLTKNVSKLSIMG